MALVAFILPAVILADEYTGTNFKVLDPVLAPGGYFTSDHFHLHGAITQIAIGTSTASSFQVKSGFLYYPYVSTPVVVPVAGNSQVSLSWSPAQGLQGWTVSGYNVGQATASGGPYSFTSLGNVTSSTRTGLTNGTTYYFVIRAEDAFGNSIATSTEVSAAPVAPTPVTPPSDSGGGGGGMITPVTRAILKGYAYPYSSLTILKDGAVAGTLKADLNGNFSFEQSVAGGIYTFSIFAIDPEDRRSLTFSFTTPVPYGVTVTISDIVISPTIGADKSQVKLGNDIKFFGFAYPNSQINLVVNSPEPMIATSTSNKLGIWTSILNSTALTTGDHTAKSQTLIPNNLISSFSESLAFRVGDKDVVFGKLPSPFPAAPACNKNGDINNDKKVNLIDFSILLYFWQQRNPANPCADINRDGIVNLFDFSIMMFWWTG